MIAVGGSATVDGGRGELPSDPRGVAMTGAAGGLSGGLWAGVAAELRPGAPYVLDVLDFNTRLRTVAAVVVGEGRLDGQSVMGKIVGEIAGRARAASVPLHAIVGQAQIDGATAARIGLRSVTEATTLGELESAGERLARAVAGPV
jgi:glycerate kinase